MKFCITLILISVLFGWFGLIFELPLLAFIASIVFVLSVIGWTIVTESVEII